MSMIPREPLVYDDGRTKQAFKDSTDINKILAKAQRTGTISHLQKHGAFYGDFADFNFEDAQFALARATSIFEELPSEVRAEFKNDPSAFFRFVNDPKNVDDLARVLPELAKPGTQLPVVSAAQKAAEAAGAPITPDPVVEPSPPTAPPET